MPLYDYKCSECEETGEDLRPYSRRSDPGPECVNGHGPMEYSVSATHGQVYNHKAAWRDRNTNFTEI